MPMRGYEDNPAGFAVTQCCLLFLLYFDSPGGAYVVVTLKQCHCLCV